MSDLGFRLFFNRKKQWVDVCIHDVHPNTFERHGGGRWGYFEYSEPLPKFGKFGELHLVETRIRVDLIAHELPHVTIRWFSSRGLDIFKHEERFCVMIDELTRNFWKEYKKVGGKLTH